MNPLDSVTTFIEAAEAMEMSWMKGADTRSLRASAWQCVGARKAEAEEAMEINFFVDEGADTRSLRVVDCVWVVGSEARQAELSVRQARADALTDQ